MPKNALNEDSYDDQVEHIQANVQDSGMQKDGCYKAPVLPFQNRLIIFCAVCDQYIRAFAIRKRISEEIMQCMRTGGKRHLVSSQTPHYQGDHSDCPRNPGDTCKSP